jgi:hypothetical protein
MLVRKNITKLVGKELSVANPLIYVAMRMTVNPVLHRELRHEVVQVGRESSVYLASLKFLGHQVKGGDMMGCHKNVLRPTGFHTLLDKRQAAIVLPIKSAPGETFFSIEDAMKICHSGFYRVGFLTRNVRPQRTCHQIDVIGEMYYLII